jgi:hypothetical protein
MRELTLTLHEDVYEKLEHYAKARGLATEEAARFLIGDILASGMFNQGIAIPALKDPWDMLYDMLESMGICKCDECFKKLTAKEIKVNSVKCFTCKPDISGMEF